MYNLIHFQPIETQVKYYIECITCDFFCILALLLIEGSFGPTKYYEQNSWRYVKLVVKPIHITKSFLHLLPASAEYLTSLHPRFSRLSSNNKRYECQRTIYIRWNKM